MGVWELLGLLAHSPIHAKYGPSRLKRWFEVPFRLGRLMEFRDDDGRLIGVVTWAHLSADAETRWHSGEPLEPADWSSGDRLWFIDFIAPFGGVHKIVRHLKEGPFRLAKRARTVRTHGTGKIQRTGEYRREFSKTPGSAGQPVEPVVDRTI